MSKFERMLSPQKALSFLRFLWGGSGQNRLNRTQIFWRNISYGAIALLLLCFVAVTRSESLHFAKALLDTPPFSSRADIEVGATDIVAHTSSAPSVSDPSISEPSRSDASVGMTNRFDPLTLVEQDDVLNSALSEISKNPQTAKPIQAAGLRRETLLIERHKEPKQSQRDEHGTILRRGDAYIYDYDSDILIHAIIDLESGAVDEIEQSQGVQLPLTPNEIERALTLAYANDIFRQRLQAEFEAITGNALSSFDDLEVRAFIFHSDSLIGNVVPEAESCGINRCAHLLLYTVDDIAFEMLPVINMSTGVVVPEARAVVELSTSEMPIAEQSVGGDQ